jgi:flagellar biosynthesis/type III secretory pathway protein FliH
MEGREEGRAEGRDEGREEGRAEGRNEGREEGRVEGRYEGRAQGEEIGRIHLCERLLKRPLTPTEQLLSRSLAELVQLGDDLQAQVLRHD